MESRRDRQRAATETEIKEVARRQLVASGGTELSLRGIAREMGMTAPGLYRYFENLGSLAEAMCHDFLDEVNAQIHVALEAAGDDVAARVHAAIRAFRDWAVAHPAEFGLLFRSKGPGPVAFPGQEAVVWEDCTHSQAFAGIFLGLFQELWAESPFPVPDPERHAAGVVDQLVQLRAQITIDLPDGAVWAFAHGWVRLYSVIALDVLGQLSFMFADVEPYFEAELCAVVREFGLEYLPRHA